MSITLSKGSLLSVLTSRRVYQPLWQIIYVFQPDRPLQLLVSDGENVANCVSLKPSCHLTYNKTEWKIKQSKKAQDEAILSYKYPIFKIIEFEVARNDTTSVILLTKIKLMGWSKDGVKPEILTRAKIPLIVPKGSSYAVKLKSSENVEEWERPRFHFNEDTEDGLESLAVYNDKYPGEKVAPIKPYSDEDILTGDLSILGPKYLDVVKICGKCRLLTYQTESRIASFTPPTKNFAKELSSLEILKDDKLHFCACDDESQKFREEFQSKCIVVNQETSPAGKSNKVQCIMIGRDPNIEDTTAGRKPRKNIDCDTDFKKGFENSYILPQHVPRNILYSPGLSVCEKCGEEGYNLASCRQCHKVYYCSPACKRADVKDHTAVCRAYITVRRYKEERANWSAKLREPEDGCGTCGFWRDSLTPCNICQQVFFCCERCEERGKEKHKTVCIAYSFIKIYTDNLATARRCELD